MSEIKDLTKRIVDFRDKRDWKQFHNAKDMALSLVLEATEVLEHFQWKKEGDIENYLVENKDKVGEELADVLYWVLLMSHDLGLDIKKLFEEKMKQNEAKYSVEKAKGKSDKYTKL
ncbi:MAG: nucleotide pyrophosphohydrolase [Patescibacteria group bacterium]